MTHAHTQCDHINHEVFWQKIISVYTFGRLHQDCELDFALI